MPRKTSNDRKFWFFRFEPQQFAKYLTTTDEESGKRFKELLARLITNEAPEDTPEYEMLVKASFRSQIYTNNFNKRKDRQGKAPASIPSKTDIYDYAMASGLPEILCREWYEWASSKNFEGLTTTWQRAMTAFVKKRIKKDTED